MGDHKLVMLFSCETQGQDDALVFCCSIQGLLMKQPHSLVPTAKFIVHS